MCYWRGITQALHVWVGDGEFPIRNRNLKGRSRRVSIGIFTIGRAVETDAGGGRWLRIFGLKGWRRDALARVCAVPHGLRG